MFFVLSKPAIALEDCSPDLQLLSNATLNYPGIFSISEAHNIQEGYVVTNFVVETDGSVSEISIVETQVRSADGGPDESCDFFNASALKSLQQWKYDRPAGRCKKQQKFTFEVEE